MNSFQRETIEAEKEAIETHKRMGEQLIEFALVNSEMAPFVARIVMISGVVSTASTQMRELAEIHPYVYINAAPDSAIERYNQLLSVLEDTCVMTEKLMAPFRD